jgi:hypothetical protein
MSHLLNGCRSLNARRTTVSYFALKMDQRIMRDLDGRQVVFARRED